VYKARTFVFDSHYRIDGKKQHKSALGGIFLNPIYTAKFGGTSLADAGQFRRAADIIKRTQGAGWSSPARPETTVSEDEKVTDMLIDCHNKRRKPGLRNIRMHTAARLYRHPGCARNLARY
jgi:aspartokinase